jgi:hypothetical protein
MIIGRICVVTVDMGNITALFYFRRMGRLRLVNYYRFKRGVAIGATLKFRFENPDIGIRDFLMGSGIP